MLRSLKNIEGYDVSAIDGEVGKVVDFFLDDEGWVIRYAVVQTGRVFLSGVRVLISPVSFRPPEWAKHTFPVDLTMDKVKKSPGVDLDKPVSRQHEREFFGYYGYQFYWDLMSTRNVGASAHTAGEPAADFHLRSARELRGYHIRGIDDSIGHVADFVVDDESWDIRYLVVDTRSWGLGKKVLIAPEWANRVNWAEGVVNVDMLRAEIRDSPEWNPNELVNREYEARLYDYHGRPAYWTRREAARPSPVSHSGRSAKMTPGHGPGNT